MNALQRIVAAEHTPTRIALHDAVTAFIGQFGPALPPQLRDGLSAQIGFDLMRDSFAGTVAANPGFDLLDSIEALALIASRSTPDTAERDANRAQQIACDIVTAAQGVVAAIRRT
jgi:hypothetical protein